MLVGVGRVEHVTRAGAAAGSDDLTAELVALVLGLVGRMREHFQDRAAEFDLSPPQAHALMHMGTPHVRSMGDLAETMHCDASNVTGIIDRLEERGLVERRPGDRDRRVKTLVMTAAGEALRERLGARLLDPATPFDRLSEQQRRTLRALLREMLPAGASVLP